MIEITGLEFRYPEGNFNLKIEKLFFSKGEKIAVTAPSGYGKTTFLNLISGILPPDKGTIKIDGRAINELGEDEKRSFRITNIGFVFQDFELVEYLSLRDNILFPYFINPRKKMSNEVEKSFDELVEKFGLSDKLGRNIGKLSQGERQRVAICRALLSSPKMILADEPTGNLDPDNKYSTIRELVNYSDSTDSVLIVVTHDFSLVENFDKHIDLRDYYG